jgi:hypothetical protein
MAVGMAVGVSVAMSVTSWRIHHHELRRRALKVVVALSCRWYLDPSN